MCVTSEVRLLVYQQIFCYEEIQLDQQLDDKNVDPRRDGLWLQHNPPNNPLAIMAVSRRVYNEARGVFYTRNKFTFNSPSVLSVFLIGIGPKNAKLLRSVWRKTEHCEYEDVTQTIRQCLPPTNSNAMIPDQEVASRHAEQNQSLLSKHFPQPLPGYAHSSSRLVWPEVATRPSSLNRWRFKMYANARKECLFDRSPCWKGKAVFELCVQRGKKNQEGGG